MSIETGPFHEYDVGNHLAVWDLNNVRRTLKKLAHSLPSDGIVGHNGVVTRRRGDRRGVSIKKARIISTLQREDHLLGLSAVDYYTIEVLGAELADWLATHGIYYKGDVVKHEVDLVIKSYVSLVEHLASAALPPPTPSHWEETSILQALVFGYSGNLLETIPWFQPGDIVYVIYYEDERFTQTWWIIETVTRVEEEGEDENGDPIIICSMTWDAKANRAKAVYT